MRRRYENLKIGEGLSRNHRYQFACNELSSIIKLGYSRLPKDLKALIFQDTLSAFRLLPDVNTSAAVSAANLLLKSVESVLPKQKKNLATVEFKQAKVALKRRSKSHEEEDIAMPSLPLDILIHIFTFLDLSSMLSSSQVSRSWNKATYDDSLWRSQFDLHFNHIAWNDIQSFIDWREAFKKAYIDKSSKVLRTARGFCSYCDSIVWHHNLRCPNELCRLKSGNKLVELTSTHQLVNYLLGIAVSSDESDSDDEAIPGLWAYPSLH